ncbi:hypothetical protein [Microbaculum sp. FT89]|uniref:hypothetical protein n=1 Tax=Microbaculum sp. FT89 TaxID=3447298 RepID=UPI003F52F908
MPYLRAAILGAAATAVLLLAGCGVKPSQLQPPADTEASEIRDPNIKKAPPKDGTKPDKPFILDGLLM